MALGKPTIVTDPDGARDYIVDGVNGFLTPPGNAAALADRLRLLISDGALARRVGEAARAAAADASTDAYFRRLIGALMERARR